MATNPSNPYVDMLVQAGMAVDKATAKVAQMKEYYMTKKGMTDPKDIDRQLHIDIVRLATVLASTKEVQGIVIGFSELRDTNDYQRKQSLAKYTADPDEAVDSGSVAVIGGKPTALDTRKFLDKEETQENPNFGKALPVVMQRSIYIFTNGALMMAYGNQKVELGMLYKFRGSISKKGNLTLSSQVAPIPLGKVDAKQLYAEFRKYADKASESMGLADVFKAPAKTFIIVEGYIGDSGESRNGGSHIVLMADGVMKGIRTFFRAPEMTEDVTGIPQSTTVLVFGKTGDMKDQRDPTKVDRIINGVGIVRSAESSLIERAPKEKEEMDALLFE